MVTTEFSQVHPLSLAHLTRDDIDRLRGMSWSDHDREVMGLGPYNLPPHLASRVYIIATHGSRNWTGQADVWIPGNSVIRLYNANGTIEMGWNRLVKPSGRFVDNGEIVGPAGAGFTFPGVNRYCMLVSTKIGNAPRTVFVNYRIPNWGASVGDAYWAVAANDGGACTVAFNDEDNNNSGTFTQYLRIQEASVFAEWVANLAR